MGSVVANSHATESDGSGGGGGGGGGGNALFAGLKFWFSRTVPQRQYLEERARLHGAHVVQLEKEADVLLVDHARGVQKPGTHSYRFVEASMRAGALANLDDHAIGPAARVNRPVGSRETAPKRSRTPFTPADDQILRDFVEPYRRAGGSWKGNEIYKQIERLYPHHTYQSWRDRYIKYLAHLYRDAVADAQELPNVPSQSVQQTHPATTTTTTLPPPATTTTPAPHPATRPATRPATTTAPAPRPATTTAPAPRPATPPPSSSRPATPPSSSPAPDALTPLSQRSSSVQRDPVVFSPSELGHGFSTKVASNLYIAVRTILDCSPESREAGWVTLARDYGYAVPELKAFFHNVILPRYYDRHPRPGGAAATSSSEDAADDDADEQASEEEERVEACVKCLTTQSREWYQHSRHRLLCNACGRLSKNLGVLKPSTSSDAVERDNEPEAAPTRSRSPTRPRNPARPRVMVDRASSPIRPPSPRSPSYLPRPQLVSPAKRPQTPPTPLAKRRRLSPGPNYEIPATPDPVVLGRSSPRLPSPRLPRTASPLLELSALLTSQLDDADHEQEIDHEKTSPMKINLLGDRIASSSSHASSDFDAASIHHQDFPAEQSPDHWDTAPDNKSLPYETAPTSPIDPSAAAARHAEPPIPMIDLTGEELSSSPPARARGDSFDEEELDEPPGEADQDLAQDEANADDDDDDDEYTVWKTRQRRTWSHLVLNRNDLDAILQQAIIATSFDFDTADRVVEIVVDTYSAGRGKSAAASIDLDGRMLPDDIPGCWTPEDDECLYSGDDTRLRRVRRKHGLDRCEDRITFLQEYNEQQ